MGACLTAPTWLSESWLLTVERSPLYCEISSVLLLDRGPGLTLGRRSAMTIVPDITPTVLEMAGESFGGVPSGERDEHRPFVVSCWPLYLAEGEIVTAVGSKARKITDYVPITVTTRERSAILGGPDDEPELYDLENDPRERVNVWDERPGEGETLSEAAISLLEQQGTPEEYLAPRRKALIRSSLRR